MSQLMVSHGLKYLNEDNQNTLVQDCKNIINNLNAMIKTLEQRGGKKP